MSTNVSSGGWPMNFFSPHLAVSRWDHNGYAKRSISQNRSHGGKLVNKASTRVVNGTDQLNVATADRRNRVRTAIADGPPHTT
jgi:hypothetical protein